MRQIRAPVLASCALLMEMEWNEPDFASFQRGKQKTEDNDDTSFQIEFRLILNEMSYELTTISAKAFPALAAFSEWNIPFNLFRKGFTQLLRLTLKLMDDLTPAIRLLR